MERVSLPWVDRVLILLLMAAGPKSQFWRKIFWRTPLLPACCSKDGRSQDWLWLWLIGCWGCWDFNKGEDLQWFCDGRQSSIEESSCLAAGWPTSLWQEIHLVITRHWLLDCLPKIWGMIYDWKIKNYSLFRKEDVPCKRSQMVKAKTSRITNTNTDVNCNQMSDL